MFRNVLLFFVALAALFAVLRWTRRPKRLFEIRVSEGDVTILGPVPNHDQADVREYVRGLRLPVGARIVGVEDGADFRLMYSKSVRLDDRDRLGRYLREGSPPRP